MMVLDCAPRGLHPSRASRRDQAAEDGKDEHVQGYPRLGFEFGRVVWYDLSSHRTTRSVGPGGLSPRTIGVIHSKEFTGCGMISASRWRKVRWSMRVPRSPTIGPTIQKRSGCFCKVAFPIGRLDLTCLPAHRAASYFKSR
jgi:hypothetical protein